MRKYKFFKNVISNVIIAAIVVAVFSITFLTRAVSVPTGLKPIYRGESKSNVSLMVNVYWGTEFLDEMLSIFDKHSVTTTFFVGGSWVSQNEDYLQKIYQKGHEIGNHGYHHKDHKKITQQQNRDEISITHQLVKDILGIEMTLFAPPSGSFSENTLKIASELGYKSIMWTKDTIDWRDKDAALILSRATKNIAGGDLVLMHPTAATVRALDGILTQIKQKNLKVTPVSQVLPQETL